jgi:hypothetical protein
VAASRDYEACQLFGNIARFMKSVPVHCLQYIRELEIFLPFWAYDDMNADMTSDLRQAIGTLAVNMGRLSLAVHIDVDLPHKCTDWCNERDDSTLAHWFATQYLLVERFGRLFKLTSFFVFIGSLRYQGEPIDQEVARYQEKVLEQLVMGHDYNAADFGKLPRRRSSCESAGPKNARCMKV